MSRKVKPVVLASITAFLSGGAACTASAERHASPAASASACSGTMPPSLAVPSGHRLGFELLAEGVQVYSCADSPGTTSGPAWTFQAPEATLLDRGGTHAGTHGAGPTWEALDGSAVVAAKVESAPSGPTAIPWLLLRASSHRPRPGRMADVTFVQRIDTSGGVAPSEGCSAAKVGAVARVPYRAVYCFYRAQGASPEGEAVSYGSPRL